MFELCGIIRYAFGMTKETELPFIEWKFARKRDEWMRRLAAVPEKLMPSGAKLVAFRLSLYMHDKKRRAHPSYAALAVHCGMSERMVQQHTKKLEEAKWIEVSRRRNTGNRYWLKYPWMPDEFADLDLNIGSGVPLDTESEFSYLENSSTDE